MPSYYCIGGSKHGEVLNFPEQTTYIRVPPNRPTLVADLSNFEFVARRPKDEQYGLRNFVYKEYPEPVKYWVVDSITYAESLIHGKTFYNAASLLQKYEGMSSHNKSKVKLYTIGGVNHGLITEGFEPVVMIPVYKLQAQKLINFCTYKVHTFVKDGITVKFWVWDMWDKEQSLFAILPYHMNRLFIDAAVLQDEQHIST